MIRLASSSLIPGKTVLSLYAGHGVRADAIPATGTNGPGFLYNDVAAQSGQPSDEFRALITQLPSAGTLEPQENSAFKFSGAPAGTYSFSYEGFKNGVSYGTFTETLTIGAAQVDAVVAYTVPARVFAAQVAAVAPAALVASVSYTVPSRVFTAQVAAVAPGAVSASVAYTVPSRAFAAQVDASEPVAVTATVSYQVKAPVFGATAQIAGSIVYIADAALIVERTGR